MEWLSEFGLAAERTDARLGAVAGARQTPGYAGKVNLFRCLVI